MAGSICNEIGSHHSAKRQGLRTEWLFA